MSDEMLPQDQAPATKADLSNFATKADFQNFVTKADLTFATRADLGVMRDEIIGAVKRAVHPLAIEITCLQTDVTEIRSHIKEKLVTRDEFHSRMDAFTRRVENQDWSAAKNRARLDDHEDRIKSLEDKRS